MRQDITSRRDIESFVMAFYEKVKQDDTIGFIFNDIVTMDWQHHIPVITDFWETILLDNPVYTKNAMEVHYTLNKKVLLTKEYFDRWLQLFTTTIDELFEGEKAELAKTRAKSIAAVMALKMNNTGNKHSIL